MTAHSSPKRARSLPGGIFAEELRRLARMHPVDRVPAVERLQADCLVLLASLADVRAELAQDLRDTGLTWREVGELLGVSTARAHNIATGESGERDRKRERREQLGEAAVQRPLAPRDPGSGEG